jgi:hypothetical protein
MPKSASYIRHGRGLTFIELIIVISCIGLLSAILLSALLEPRMYAGNTDALNNQAGWSFRAGNLVDQESSLMRIPVTDGGLLETVGTGGGFMHFGVQTNESTAPFFDPDRNSLKP